MRGAAAGCLAGVVMLLASAGGVLGADKSQYSIFNPTPDRLLRDMTTDRPDNTESPFTVDAGRVQVETNLFGFSRSRPDAGGVVTDTYEFATTNIRIGLTSNVEVDVVWQPYGVVRSRRADPINSFRDSGVGGVDLRAKFNLWGNDTFDKPGATALGLLPFVTLPTNKSNGISPEHVEGGLIVPFAINLPNNFGLGLNVGTVFLRDDGSSGYHTEYLTWRPCPTRGTTRSARITKSPPSSAEPAVTSSFSAQASRTSSPRTSSSMRA
jgi:Putative MetA-pathway of phenol degradation